MSSHEERTELAEAPLTLEAFCALATRRARRRDPTYPALTTEGLTVTSSSGYHCCRTLDARDADGRGWVLDTDGHYEGPAEIITVDDWTAVAHGLGLRFRYEAANDRGSAWEEPVGDQ